MRRLIAAFVTVAMILPASPLLAARAAKAAQPGQTGNVNGVAQNANGQNLANYTVRIRNVDTGQLAGTTTSGASGQFTFVGLDPANYVVEIVDSAGNIIGTSTALGVVAGQTVSITVGASMSAAGAAIAAGGTAFWTSTAGLLTIAAVGAGVTGIVVAANKTDASPSK